MECLSPNDTAISTASFTLQSRECGRAELGANIELFVRYSVAERQIGNVVLYQMVSDFVLIYETSMICQLFLPQIAALPIKCLKNSAACCYHKSNFVNPCWNRKRCFCLSISITFISKFKWSPINICHNWFRIFRICFGIVKFSGACWMFSICSHIRSHLIRTKKRQH